MYFKMSLADTIHGAAGARAAKLGVENGLGYKKKYGLCY